MDYDRDLNNAMEEHFFGNEKRFHIKENFPRTVVDSENEDWYAVLPTPGDADLMVHWLNESDVVNEAL